MQLSGRGWTAARRDRFVRKRRIRSAPLRGAVKISVNYFFPPFSFDFFFFLRGENYFTMFLNDAPPDRECCRKRVEVSACGVTWAQQDFHILPNVCMAAGSTCIIKASVACEDIRQSKHSAVVFSVGVCVLCASCAKFRISRDLAAQGSRLLCRLSDPENLYFFGRRMCGPLRFGSMTQQIGRALAAVRQVTCTLFSAGMVTCPEWWRIPAKACRKGC